MAGDLNLPHINCERFTTGHAETRSADVLLELMFSHSLTQIVKDYTRITPPSLSLLDLVFILNKVTDYTISFEDGISDHKMVVVDVFCSTSFRAKHHVKDYGHADDTAIIDFLEISFDEFQNRPKLESLEQLWTRFKEIIWYCLDNCVPTCVKKAKRRNPWITRTIIQIKCKIKRLHKKNKAKVKIACAKKNLKAEIVQYKKHFINNILTNFLRNSPRKFWLCFKEMNERIEQIVDGAELIMKKSGIAERLN